MVCDVSPVAMFLIEIALHPRFKRWTLQLFHDILGANKILYFFPQFVI